MRHLTCSATTLSVILHHEVHVVYTGSGSLNNVFNVDILFIILDKLQGGAFLPSPGHQLSFGLPLLLSVWGESSRRRKTGNTGSGSDCFRCCNPSSFLRISFFFSLPFTFCKLLEVFLPQPSFNIYFSMYLLSEPI